jgi:hypothetical protein
VILIQLCDEFSFSFRVLRQCDVILYGAALGAGALTWQKNPWPSRPHVAGQLASLFPYGGARDGMNRIPL